VASQRDGVSGTAPTRLHVVVVEPYPPEGGHFSDWVHVVAALEEAGAACTPVIARTEDVQHAKDGVVPRAVRAARGTARRAGLERATRSLDRTVRSIDAARSEAPAMAEAAAVARRDAHSAVVVISSFASTACTRRALGAAPLLEFLFEPPPARAGRITPPAPRQVFVATTARIADAVAARVGVRPLVLAHKPLPSRGVDVGADDVEDDVARAVVGMRQAPSLLVLGVLHGKKDLDLIARAPALVPEGWAVVVAGDPQVDGVGVLARVRGTSPKVPVLTVERRLARAELDQLVECSTVVLVPQRAGEASMSGVLLDAIAARRPAVARRDSSAGDVIEACGCGATFMTDDAASVREAIERAVRASWNANTAPWREHGLLAPAEWGRFVVSALERVRSTVT
jgi:hypothetical protein